MAPSWYVLLLAASSIFNGLFWYNMGRLATQHRIDTECTSMRRQKQSNLHRTGSSYDQSGDECIPPDLATKSITSVNKLDGPHYSNCSTPISSALPRIRSMLTKGFLKYKESSLVKVPYPEWAVLVQPNNTEQCNVVVNPHISRKRQFLCFALVTVTADSTYNLLRIEDDNSTKGALNVTGFFDNVANNNGRRKLSEKMQKLLPNLKSLEHLLLHTLHQRGLYSGDDVVIMVVNAGEMDLFANFACSCRAHNISMRNMLVFSGSEDVVPLIQSFGAMGIYHEPSFASVSRNASYEYLDAIFIDMMWYKSFSVWLLLKLDYNVLFQDIDLVWYRDPIHYFRTASSLPETTSAEEHEAATAADDDDEGNSKGRRERMINIHRNANIRPQETGSHNPRSGHEVVLGRSSSQSMRYKANLANGTTWGWIRHSLRAFMMESAERLSMVEKFNSSIEGNMHHQHHLRRSRQSDRLHAKSIISAVDADSWGHTLDALPQADAYLSDDGQRSLRYTPFFANSGFYYLVANNRTEYFAWTIMTAFDLLHITGSHQNVFTIRLIESLDIAGLKPKLLSLREFPSGVKFSHDKPFMKAITDNHEHPFVFHMCWTRTKYDKLRNFRLTGMWYVTEPRSAELGELGRLKDGAGAEELKEIADNLMRSDFLTYEQKWYVMSKRICTIPSPSTDQ